MTSELLIKRLNDTIPMPKYQTSGAAGLDLAAYMPNGRSSFFLDSDEIHMFNTGLFMSIPEGYEGQIRSRSGLACKEGITVINSPGTIDSDYRGEIIIGLVNMSGEMFQVKDGMRIAQLVIAPVVQLPIKEVKSLGETKRGQGGFGSTGTSGFVRGED